MIFLRRDILVFTNMCILFYPLNSHKPSLSIFNPLTVAIILLTINNTLLFWGVFCQGGLLYCFLFCIPSIKLSPICIAWVYLFEMHKNQSFEKFEIKPANAGDILQFRLSRYIPPGFHILLTSLPTGTQLCINPEYINFGPTIQDIETNP